MSLEFEDQRCPDQPANKIRDEEKKGRISYTIDFLLSLSDLDVCKKLPIGFDQSLLSEFDSFHNLQDGQRLSGSVSLQGFRRADYSSSPPNRGDSANYSRGINGRWDSRSRDSDSQSDWDSDSGKRYGNQPRRSWQNSEHDGLLGSGSFPRPSGYAAGTSAPKVRSNDHYQLNKSNEPYQPPRPYKAVPHTRRDTTHDLFNDETFGSADCTSEDRAEEERKRRVSFESMRKEQHKAFQEKQKSTSDKHKGDSVLDIAVLSENSVDEKQLLNTSNKSDDSVMIPASHNDSSKLLLPSLTPASRPLVPPGFKSTVLERNSGSKSVVHPHLAEVGNPEVVDHLSHALGKPLLNGTSDNEELKQLGPQINSSEQHNESTRVLVPFINMAEEFKNPSLAPEIYNRTTGLDNQSYKTSSPLGACDTLVNGEMIKFDANKGTGKSTSSVPNQDDSTSVLEKLFGSALTVNSGASAGLDQQHDSKKDDTWSPSKVQSSKFARWFLEDAEKKPVDDLSSGRPNNLLSLIVGGEKSRFQISDAKAIEQNVHDFPLQNSDFSNRGMISSITSTTIGIPEQLYNGDKPEAVPAVLTCEDLEQSMLSEISDKRSALQPPVQDTDVFKVKVDQPKAPVDNRASQHLLSLLHKGTDLKDMASSPSPDTESSDKPCGFEVSSMGLSHDNSRGTNSQKVHELGKSLTLETLFGTAFMKELQSVGAPVSVQRGSVGPPNIDDLESHGLLFPVFDNGLSHSTVGETVSDWTGRDGTILASNHRKIPESDKFGGHWLGSNDPLTEVNSSKLKSEVGSKLGGLDGAVEYGLPEEDSLIVVSDPVNHLNSLFMPGGDSSKAELLSSLNRPIDVTEKLAALNAVFKGEGSMVGVQERQPFLRGSSDRVEPEIRFQNIHAKPSSPQFHSPQINHGRPSFHSLESHPSPMKFPDSIIRHDPPPSHQLYANMVRPPFHHHSAGLTGFDPPPHHPMLQQMQMPGNFPPHHLLHGFPGGSAPPHPNNQAGTGFIQEPDPMQGFPIGHRNPNFNGLGMPTPASEIGGLGNHPEALQRLIEMELRSNPKQIRPLAPQGRGMYGHELDMGFRYR